MGERHCDSHFAEVRHFLPLEPIEIRLYRGTGVFEILGG
jgi:hypothetical protein